MATKRASLSELMGKAGAQGDGNLSLKHLPDMLGDVMPDLPRNPVGRHRLVRALQQRYGDNWRSLPGLNHVITQFDGEIEFEKRVAAIKAVKYRRKDGK